MAADIDEIRALVRQDLHDEDSGAYLWTDDVLNRHIERAALAYSLHVPREQVTTLSATAGSRDLSVASLAGLIRVERVEWPVGDYPPNFVGFSLWGATLTMDVQTAPADTDDVRIYWAGAHTLDGSSSTIAAAHDNIIAVGAAGYAALDRSAFAVNRVNTGGDDVWGRYAKFGQDRLDDFNRQLRAIGNRGKVRTRITYVTEPPSIFEDGRVKYT